MALIDLQCIILRQKIDEFKLECVSSGKVDAEAAFELLINMRGVLNANLPEIIQRDTYETQHDSQSGTLSSD
ncbi:hypothetical protein LCGC14_1748260 [marine sediment metagenome]|uniref:Uncharacterized protein n=1 Tax=marine sediment metagenome TaxID=412755 RepID=A0A0F9HS10_9ZZZZ